MYLGYLDKVELIERSPYQGKENDPKEPAFRWSFAFVDSDAEGKVIGPKQWLNPETNESAPIVVNKTTGINYGGKRAGLTAMVNALVGFEVPGEEAKRLDLEKLIGTFVNIVLTSQPNDAGEPRNQIAEIKRADGKILNLGTGTYLIPIFNAAETDPFIDTQASETAGSEDTKTE
jgi:hypothetical protein